MIRKNTNHEGLMDRVWHLASCSKITMHLQVWVSQLLQFYHTLIAHSNREPYYCLQLQMERLFHRQILHPTCKGLNLNS